MPAERTGRYNEWVGKDLEFGIRPEHISGLHGTAARKNTTKLAVKPDMIEPTGMETMVLFSIGGTEICARVDPETPLQLGDQLRPVALTLATGHRAVTITEFHCGSRQFIGVSLPSIFADPANAGRTRILVHWSAYS